VGFGESIDVAMDAGVFPVILAIQKFRLLFVIVGVTVMLFSLFQIWIPKHKKTKFGGTAFFGLSWFFFLIIGPSREFVYLVTAGYFVILIVPYFVTFYLVYKYKRLPEIDARLILLSTIVLFFGQVFKTWFLTVGMLWVSEAIDLVAWIMIFIGFTHPAPYSSSFLPGGSS
ncbi:MAG: hypothetical protein ACTSVM_02320, partial [Candidatus Ranarchaeia archaeon]